MSDHTLDWLAEKAIGWSHTPPINKIDTHHHIVPSFYAKAIEEQGGDPSGWPTPKWSSLASKLLMKRVGVHTAVVSVTAPGACILPDRHARAKLARQLNEYSAKLRDEDPQSFAFFVSLPNILDTEDALAEIAYGLDTLGADGVTLFTRYGHSNTYLGHPDVEPIWAELNRRRAVVFVHPTHPVDTNPINPKLPQPAIDYPHETTRTAMDMIVNGTRRKYRDCKVILSHAGGGLPYIISRVATPMKLAPNFVVSHRMGTTHAEVLEAFRSFHFDLALSSSPQVLDMLRALVPSDHILYGSDFPYAPITAYPAFLEELEGYEMDQELRDKINFGNAMKLFPRLALCNDDRA
ncbi:putative 2-amino-3-carboxymuconate-6-semialdehyde decarboxylase [Talaromyces proteolyticus]|uniref:6-methylsalicylate decarboxylase n=1 Tax=Talaromyces proteolyticus TaxID=1131652 RepID=A0AAD4KRR2_9EURO|nr:putative 2-amino-3-carboxymuconate-6-semialdehyde decarboxylase [Talaromyces proteolyticus]KAH8697706.1 putative 2-amino-3-carboxymuconate-6-semialdehyde decarboxylase [Talaromyces proteolyticus]